MSIFLAHRVAREHLANAEFWDKKAPETAVDEFYPPELRKRAAEMYAQFGQQEREQATVIGQLLLLFSPSRALPTLMFIAGPPLVIYAAASLLTNTGTWVIRGFTTDVRANVPPLPQPAAQQTNSPSLRQPAFRRLYPALAVAWVALATTGAVYDGLDWARMYLRWAHENVGLHRQWTDPKTAILIDNAYDQSGRHVARVARIPTESRQFQFAAAATDEDIQKTLAPKLLAARQQFANWDRDNIAKMSAAATIAGQLQVLFFGEHWCRINSIVFGPPVALWLAGVALP